MFEEDKQAAYDFAKVINDIVFGIVFGKAIGGGFDALQKLGKIGKISCGSQTLKNLKTVM